LAVGAADDASGNTYIVLIKKMSRGVSNAKNTTRSAAVKDVIAIVVNIEILEPLREVRIILYLLPTTIDLFVEVTRWTLMVESRNVEMVKSIVFDLIVVEPRAIASFPL
jgi:hypothetical protein